MDKVISEWRIVETDDGYRIEIKGDKARLREWIEHLRSRGPLHHMGRMPFGPWGMMSGCGPRGRWHHADEAEEGEGEKKQKE
jgi:hypothetical protein